jgi:hypothetical protein
LPERVVPMRAAKPPAPSGWNSLPKCIIPALLLAILLSDLASAGCGRWVVRETTDYLADPLFDVADSAAQDATNTTEEKNSTNLEPATNPAASKAEILADIEGKWLVELNESERDRIELILTQRGDRLQGYATLAGRGSEVHADVKGQLSSEKVDLDLKVIEKSPGQEANHYLLNLNLVNQTLSGQYELRQGDKIREKGEATASRLSS